MWPTQFMSKAFRRISFVISQFPELGGCSQCSRLGPARDTELQRAVRARGYVFWRRLTIFQRARPYRGTRRQTVLRGEGRRVRRSGSHMRRYRAWHGGGSRATRALLAELAGAGSFVTLRWREPDSNHRSLLY